jgi:hypothetical protein
MGIKELTGETPDLEREPREPRYAYSEAIFPVGVTPHRVQT